MITEKLISAIQSTFPKGIKSAVLHEPMFNGNEWLYIKECIDTRWVSSVGKFVDRFEKELAEFIGVKHAVVTVNGTAALHVAYQLSGVKPNDEVLVPTLTFIATCNAIVYCGATPHFVDSEYPSLGVDPAKLAAYLKDISVIENNVCINRLTKKPIRALCVMHVFGHPVDLDSIKEICDQHHIKLIEDTAEALGSYYKGQHVGRHGLISTLSFNGNKVITTGGGGAILTDKTDVAKQVKHLTTTAKKPHAYFYEHDEVGYNYRLPNINAALGCAQLEELPKFLKAKRKIADRYRAVFKSVNEVDFIAEPKNSKSNYWLNAILIKPRWSDQRDIILKTLNEKGIGVRPVWNLMHTLPMFQHCPKMNLSIAEDMAKRIINIPSSVVLMGGDYE